jgi:hypothetical protein
MTVTIHLPIEFMSFFDWSLRDLRPVFQKVSIGPRRQRVIQ